MFRLVLIAGMAALMGLSQVPGPQASAQDKGFRLGVKTSPVEGGGVEINEVAEYSPAKRIGLKNGHVIVTVGGKLVKTNADLQFQLKSGDTVDIVYQDGKKFYQVTAHLVSAIFADSGGKLVLGPKDPPKVREVPDPRPKKKK